MFYTSNLEKLVDKIFQDASTSNFSYAYRDTNYVANENGIKVALPGFSKEDLSIEVESGKLNISAKVEKEDEFKKSFSISFKLPLNVDVDEMSASMEHGVLHVEYNKRKEAKKVQIL